MPDFRDPVKDVSAISFSDSDVLAAVRFSNADIAGESEEWRQAVQSWLLRISSVRAALEYLFASFPSEYPCLPFFLHLVSLTVHDQLLMRECQQFVRSGDCCD